MKLVKSTAALGLLLALSGCTTKSVEPLQAGRVISCDSIALAESTNSGKSLQLDCLDGSSGVDVRRVNGPLIINVWGSWCAPCKEEIPMFRNFYEKNKGKVQILGIDVEEAKVSDGRDFVVAQGITWPNLIDIDGRSRAYFGMGVPVTWFIAPDGEVAYKKIGVLKNEKELKDLTAKYLKIVVG